MMTIENLIEQLSKLDCGDNSCIYAKNKTGMRTNGGCRCLSYLPLGLRIVIEKMWFENKKTDKQ